MSFTTDWIEAPSTPCRKCEKPGFVEYRIWDSSDSAHEDVRYRCAACAGTWWVEGPDA